MISINKAEASKLKSSSGTSIYGAYYEAHTFLGQYLKEKYVSTFKSKKHLYLLLGKYK